MKENEIVINDKSTVKRNYLQIARIGKRLPVILLAAVLLCAAAWLFFGKMTVCVTGYCEPSETKVVFMLPMYHRTQVKPGDVIWVGNQSGTVENVYSESYFTYDDILNSEDIVFHNFLNSGRCDENVSYVLGSAEFQNKISGMTEYRIVIDTVTPYQRLLGGKSYER